MKRALKKLYDLVPFKKYWYLPLRPLNLPKSVYQHLHFKGVFAVKFDHHSFKVRHYGYQIENELFWSGLTHGWEKISMQTWIELCKTSQYIVDVGANTGVYSLVAKAVNPGSRVYAFEPVTRIYDKLVDNIDLNHFDVHCYDVALSNADGQAVIYDLPSEHVYSVTVNKNTNPHLSSIETTIRTKKLATFIEEEKLPRIDLMKIDVETHEAEVLEGMQEYLARFRPTLLIEILDEEVGANVQKLVGNLGYLYFNIDEEHPPVRVETITKSNYYNYLLCSEEVAKRLKLI